MKRAFSLVEIVTVLFIIAVGLLGVLSLIIQNIQSQDYNKDNLIAYQLAQEGVEMIRGVRDSNWRAGSPYNSGLADGQFYMDYLDSAPHTHTGGAAELALVRDGQGFYRHGAGTPSGFSRLITLSQADGTSLQVDVLVTWKERNRDASYSLQTFLYDWR